MSKKSYFSFTRLNSNDFTLDECLKVCSLRNVFLFIFFVGGWSYILASQGLCNEIVPKNHSNKREAFLMHLF